MSPRGDRFARRRLTRTRTRPHRCARAPARRRGGRRGRGQDQRAGDEAARARTRGRAGSRCRGARLAPHAISREWQRHSGDRGWRPGDAHRRRETVVLARVTTGPRRTRASPKSRRTGVARFEHGTRSCSVPGAQRPQHPRHQLERARLGQRLVEVAALRRLHARRAARSRTGTRRSAGARRRPASRSARKPWRVIPTPPGWPS